MANLFRIKKRFFIVFSLLCILSNVMLFWSHTHSLSNFFGQFHFPESWLAYEACFLTPIMFCIFSRIVITSERIVWVTFFRRWELFFLDVISLNVNSARGGFHVLDIYCKDGSVKTIDFTYYNEEPIWHLIRKALQDSLPASELPRRLVWIPR